MDLYEKFKSIEADGRKRKFDQEIRDSRSRALQDAIARSEQAAAEATRQKKSQKKEKDDAIKKGQKKQHDPIKKTQKAKDDAVKKAEKQQHDAIKKAQKDKTDQAKKRDADTAKEKARDSQRTKGKTRPHAPDQGEQRTEKGTKSAARPDTKQSSPTRRLRTRDSREAAMLARSRVVRIDNLPLWLTYLDLCEALAKFQPGAIYSCSIRGSVARVTFFHSAAVRQVLQMVESGGMIVRGDDDPDSTVTRVTTVRSADARVDMADDNDPTASFAYRGLSFRPTDQEGPSGEACKTVESILAMCRQYGVPSPLYMKSYALQGRIFYFRSVKEAEQVVMGFARHRPDIAVHGQTDHVGSVDESPGIGKRASSQSSHGAKLRSPEWQVFSLSRKSILVLIGLYFFFVEWPEIQ